MKSVFFPFLLLVFIAIGCRHGNSSAADQQAGNGHDSLSAPGVDKNVASPVFQDEKTKPIEIKGKREVLALYRAIPDLYYPVKGKPENNIVASDTAHQYLKVQYSDQLWTEVKVFKDKETGREYFVVLNSDLRTAPFTNTVHILYIKAKHCIDLTDEMMPRLADGLLKDAYKSKKLKMPKTKPAYWLVMDSNLPGIAVCNNADVKTQTRLFSLPWKYGRFNVE